jgi:hypothetical protein
MERSAMFGQQCWACGRQGQPPNKGWCDFKLRPLSPESPGPKKQTTSAALCPDCSKAVDDCLTRLSR